MSATSTIRRPPPKPENLWLNIFCNLLAPGLIMTQLAKPERLGPLWALVLGIALPLGYGIYDLIRRRKWNLFSIIGVISVGLTGGLGLARVAPMTFAIKEAAVPLVFALAILGTLGTRKPLVREIILNESVIDVHKLEEALVEHHSRPAFDKLLLSSTWLLVLSFALSAVLNFVLARLVIKSPGGTPEFTQELGRMTWLSWPVIMVPSMAMMIYVLWRLFSGIHKLTGLDIEQLMHVKAQAKPDAAAPSDPTPSVETPADRPPSP